MLKIAEEVRGVLSKRKNAPCLSICMITLRSARTLYDVIKRRSGRFVSAF